MENKTNYGPFFALVFLGFFVLGFITSWGKRYK